MNKYKKEPRREEMYLVDYLQQARGSMSPYDWRLILISLGTFLIVMFLCFMLINHIVIFNRCVWIATLVYLAAFTITVYSSIRGYQHRSDELSRYLKKAFNDLRMTFMTVKQVHSLFLIWCMIIMIIFLQGFLYVTVFNNLGITAESASNNDIKFMFGIYTILLIFNLGGICSLYSLIIIFVCIFVKVKKSLGRLF